MMISKKKVDWINTPQGFSLTLPASDKFGTMPRIRHTFLLGLAACIIFGLIVFMTFERMLKDRVKPQAIPHLKWTPGSMFHEKPLVIWSNDFHISPIQDLKELLQPLGVAFIDKSLSGSCGRTKTCATNLRIINNKNGIKLHSNLIPKFYKTYLHDPEMLKVDAFVCFHPSAMCELFIPFNRSIIVIASTRYEMGRWTREDWSHWNDNLVKISQDPKNIVAANNVYDAKYIEYFTGIKPPVLVSYCDYAGVQYNPTRPGFLLAELHHSEYQKIFMNLYQEACDNIQEKCPEILPLRKKYKHYEYSDLTAHQGLVYVPYQVSVMSMFEQYRMNIPLFFPSIDLLAELQFQYQVMNERTWAGVSRIRSSGSVIPPHFSQKNIPDPNCETDIEAIKYWIQFSDFYQIPHVVLYDSFPDLINKLRNTDLVSVSSKMKAYNSGFKEKLLDKWKAILSTVANHSRNRPH